MKKYCVLLSILAVLACCMITVCSSRSTGVSSIFGKELPEEITSIEMSGSYNGSELKPWELTQEEVEELRAWLFGLSLKHKTYAEGKAPNKVWSGGTSYRFNVNHGDLSFTWLHIDKAYIVYEGEWYEITNGRTPPLGLAI